MTDLFGNDDHAYAGYRDRKARESRDLSEKGREIGPLPDVVDAARKAKCKASLRDFLETYLSASFTLAWSPDHLDVIARLETVILVGGLYALAMPRGDGKTTLCEGAGLWALVYGHRLFPAMIGASEDAAVKMLDSIKKEIESNDLLAEDFPEVCHPVRSLEGINQRASGQLLDGRQTHISWKTKEIVLPTVQGSVASGGTICVAGITGRVRGMKHKRTDGTVIRPDLVLVDDPQTDESAHSPSQCDTRERILAGAILGLAGPGKKIAGLMPVTVVRAGDLADRMLDREKHPEWQGKRAKMLYAFPTNTALWDEYQQLRVEELRERATFTAATEFYRVNREAMDEGAVVGWEARFNHDEISALQHAMNLKFADEIAFFAEYQNEPLPEASSAEETISEDAIVKKINGLARRVVPISAIKLTAFIDVQGEALFWIVCAWEEDFTGYVIDYGTEPDQKLRPGTLFTLRKLRHTLSAVMPNAGLEGAIYAGLDRLTSHLLGREWDRDDGAKVRIDRCLVDANWGTSTDVVYQFCRQSSYAAQLMPSHGRYVGAKNKPYSQIKRAKGERAGLNWRVPVIKGKRAVRHVNFDANYWKSFVHQRLAVSMGDAGCLSLFGTAGQEEHHRLLAMHLTSEHPVRTEGHGRTVDEWSLRPGQSENHFFDGLVGASVAASMEGCEVIAATETTVRKRKRVVMSQVQRRMR